MKKLLVAATLFVSMVMTSCGAPSADSIVKEINSCKNPIELAKIADNNKEAIEKMSEEDQMKIAEASAKKTAEFAGSAMDNLNSVKGLLDD